AELDFLDVRLANDLQVLLFNGFFVGLRDELALHLVLDVRFVLAQHHFARRFARTKPRKARLPLKLLRNRLEGLVHALGFDLDADEFFAGGQRFYRYIHAQGFFYRGIHQHSFALISSRVQPKRRRQWAQGARQESSGRVIYARFRPDVYMHAYTKIEMIATRLNSSALLNKG